MRLIDADSLSTKVIFVCEDGYDGADMVLKKDIDNAPTIEAEPVRYGRWMWDADMQGWYCPHCPTTLWKSPDVPEAFRRCPNCGAKMDGGAENE